MSFLFSLSQPPPFCLSATSSLACTFSLMCVCVCVLGGGAGAGSGYSERGRCMCVHQGLIAVCIETSVISQRSLPCRPANNQHPLCACSFSLCLSSLSPSLSLSCLMPVATTTSPTPPLFPAVLQEQRRRLLAP